MKTPPLELVNCQEAVSVDLTAIEKRLSSAWTYVFASETGAAPSLLTPDSSVEISILDDTEIARVHGEFMDDPTPTDVITFHHGELLISAETARREADVRHWEIERELLLYIIHGLLHLHGHDDQSLESRATMHAIQDSILENVWPVSEA